MNLDNYPLMKKFATEMTRDDKYASIGTEEKEVEIMSILNKRRIKSMIIKGDPGVGKTQIVETLASKNKDFIFFSIDLDVMGGEGNNMLGENIKGFLNEAIQYDKNSERDLVLFIDEFHKVGMEGYESGLDGFKTVLARGDIRLIGATTYEEFTDYVEQNQALNDRLDPVKIEEPPKSVIEQIISDMWVKELGDEEPLNESLIKKIVEYGKYIPSEAEPRKSIGLLDRMIGRYTTQNVSINEALLDRIIFERSGINPNIRLDINEIEKELRKNIKGQDESITVLLDGLNVAMAGLNPEGAPMGSYIFLGPTGVGKTEVAKQLARLIFDGEEKMLRYDMSEYQGEDAADRWKNDVSRDIGEHPYSVVLCDEAEKAYRGVLDLLLQITSDARLKNRYNRPVTFENAIIILTTNIGYKVFEKNRSLGVGMSEGEYDTDTAGEVLQSSSGASGFRPELVNRMTGILTFNPLDSQTKKEIAEMHIEKFKVKLEKEHKLLLETSDRVLDYIYRENVSDATTSGGGRDILNRVRNYLHVQVAKLINKYSLDNDRHLLRVKVEPLGQLISEVNRRNSTALLRVIEYDVLNKDGRVETHRGFNHKNVDRAYDALHEKAEVSYDFVDIPQS